MALLLGSKNNKLIDLIHKGGVNYGESLIPLTPGAIEPASNTRGYIRILKKRRRKSRKSSKRTKRKHTKRTRKSRR